SSAKPCSPDGTLFSLPPHGRIRPAKENSPMKHVPAVLLFFLAMSMPLFAQTTYTLNSNNAGDVFFNGHAYTSAYYAYQMPMTNGAEINTLVAAANSACPNQSAPFLGYIFDSFNGAENPCNPITKLSFGPMVSDPTVL